LNLRHSEKIRIVSYSNPLTRGQIRLSLNLIFMSLLQPFSDFIKLRFWFKRSPYIQCINCIHLKLVFFSVDSLSRLKPLTPRDCARQLIRSMFSHAKWKHLFKGIGNKNTATTMSSISKTWNSGARSSELGSVWHFSFRVVWVQAKLKSVNLSHVVSFWTGQDLPPSAGCH